MLIAEGIAWLVSLGVQNCALMLPPAFGEHVGSRRGGGRSRQHGAAGCPRSWQVRARPGAHHGPLPPTTGPHIEARLDGLPGVDAAELADHFLRLELPRDLCQGPHDHALGILVVDPAGQRSQEASHAARVKANVRWRPCSASSRSKLPVSLGHRPRSNRVVAARKGTQTASAPSPSVRHSASWPPSRGGLAAAATVPFNRRHTPGGMCAHPRGSSAHPLTVQQVCMHARVVRSVMLHAKGSGSSRLNGSACLPLVMLKIRAQLGSLGGCGIVHTRGSMAWHEARKAARAARSSRLRMTVGLQGWGGGGGQRQLGAGGTACRHQAGVPDPSSGATTGSEIDSSYFARAGGAAAV